MMETESMGSFCRPERPAASRSWKGLGPTLQKEPALLITSLWTSSLRDLKMIHLCW